MKKISIYILIFVITAFSFFGCGKTQKNSIIKPQSTTSENMELMYVYVKAIGDDWIYGNDTKIYCGKNHGYVVCNTIKVEYYKSDVLDEQGVVKDDLSNEYTYNQVIKKVVYSRKSDYAAGEPVFDKPVIYLYPEKTTDVFVSLDFDGKLTETIPAYNDGWHVVANPDGKIIADDGKTYPYLFWEGVPNSTLTITEGFCVPGCETREFFEKILPEIGLLENEYTEFIDFWLPRMECNEYNVIQFQGENYTSAAKLDITPTPDSVLRVFMSYRPSDEFVSLKAQTFAPFVRTGFTVVDWGGTCL